MKKILFTTILLSWAMVSFSQGGGGRNQPGEGRKEKLEKLKEFRKKLLIEKLSLTTDEQKNFLPLYEESKEKERTILVDFRNKYPKNKLIIMTDEEANKYLDDYIKLQESRLALEKEYIEKYRKVLPVRKVIIIKRVEKEIQQAIIKKAGEIKLGISEEE